MFGPKRNKLTDDWRKLHNEELHVLCYSPSVIGVIKSKIIRWAGHVASIVQRRSALRILVGKPEGKSPLGRPWCGGENYIKMVIQEVG
jgi:hypothetical protein